MHARETCSLPAAHAWCPDAFADPLWWHCSLGLRISCGWPGTFSGQNALTSDLTARAVFLHRGECSPFISLQNLLKYNLHPVNTRILSVKSKVFSLCAHLCGHHQDQDIDHFQHSRRLLCFCPAKNAPPWANHSFDLYHHRFLLGICFFFSTIHTQAHEIQWVGSRDASACAKCYTQHIPRLT